MSKTAPPAAVRVELSSGTMPNAIATITFPKKPADAIYQVVATAVMKDTFGSTGTVKYRVWSHVLPVGPQKEDIDRLLLALSRLMKDAGKGLLFASQITDIPTPETDPTILEPQFRHARMVRLFAMSAAKDKLITIGELKRLVRGTKLFGGLNRIRPRSYDKP